MIEFKFTQCENPTDAGINDYTNYMLKLECRKNGGWLYADLMPRGDISLLPEAVCLGAHADETVRIAADENGKPRILRLESYLDRLSASAKRMGLPDIEKELVTYGLKQLVSIEKQYLDDGMLFAHIMLVSKESDPDVFPARDALLTVTLRRAPQPQFNRGISVCTSDTCMLTHPYHLGAPFAYAVREGIHEARLRGHDNVLWLDSTYHRYIDSLAGYDVFFRIGDSVLYSGDGVTAKTAHALMEEWGIEVCCSRVSTDSILKDHRDGKLTEVFAVNTGELAVPITRIQIGDNTIELSRTKLAKKLFDTLLSYERGELADTFGWVSTL